MSSEENLGPLPNDLIIEIFSRLPSKSIARFRCLSKQWASILTSISPYFTELFLTQSKTRPRLLFAVERNSYQWRLYSCPQPKISYENSTSSLSVTAEFYMSLPKYPFFHISPLVSGLIYCPNTPNYPILCNPSTSHLFSLPELETMVGSYFGYDPINKQFSVLAICHPGIFYHHDEPSSFHILKLGSGRLSWRSLDYHLHHFPSQTNICINGILYYIAYLTHDHAPHKIASFDLNSEEFNLIDEPWYGDLEHLVNFKGKLGVIMANWVEFSNERFHLHVELWVLEDANKQEWSKHVYNILQSELWNKKGKPDYNVEMTMTATGDIVLSLNYTTNPFYVYFFNLEKKILQKVEIKGFEEFKRDRFYGCVEYVEELRGLKWN